MFNFNRPHVTVWFVGHGYTDAAEAVVAQIKDRFGFADFVVEEGSWL